MPNQITMFVCNQCQHIYRDYNQALECESIPTEPNEIALGSSILFENEETFTGMRYVYNTLSGVILHRYKTRVKENGFSFHKWIYVVSVPERQVEMEVTMVTDEFGSRKLLSLAEKKFKLGYAQSLQDTGGYI